MSVIDMWAAKQLIGNLRVKADPFGIYAQRRALAQVMPGVAVYRGDEWWTPAADKVIQNGIDAQHVRTFVPVAGSAEFEEVRA